MFKIYTAREEFDLSHKKKRESCCSLAKAIRLGNANRKFTKTRVTWTLIMGWDCFYNGALADVVLQEKVIDFLVTLYKNPALTVRPAPQYSAGCNFDYYGIVDYIDSDGTPVGMQFVFDRNAGGRLVSFVALPHGYLCEFVDGWEPAKGVEGKEYGRPDSDHAAFVTTDGGCVREQQSMAFALSIIKLRWWPTLKCCDDWGLCAEYLRDIWNYGLTNRLMDEKLDFDACFAVFAKEQEKYFPSPPEPKPAKIRPKLRIFNPAALKIKIADLEISVRTASGLKAKNINTIGELIQLTPQELKQGTSMGNKSIAEITNILSEYGLCLKKNPQL